MFVIVLLLSILSLLFIIVSLITLVQTAITLSINFFCKYNFYSLNIDLVYTTCHIRTRKYFDSTYILYCKSLYLQNLHCYRIYKYHYSKFVYYCILTNLIDILIFNLRAIIWPVWLNGRVFIYELSGCGFVSRCSAIIR